tara:strand:- start:147 stop:464 length:318 start_codon:yes stop_codon:yes gene_type:complete
MFISFSLCAEQANDTRDSYKGNYIKFANLAFDNYLAKKSKSKYKSFLIIENHTFNFTEKGNSVIVEILFNSKEFKKKTSMDMLGGGGEFVIAKDLGTVVSSKLYR